MQRAIGKARDALLAIAIPAILFLILVLFGPSSFGLGTLWDLFRQAILAAILSWGMIFSVKLGIWNYAVGGTTMVSIVIAGNIALRIGAGVPVTILIIVLFGTLVGLLTGTLFILFRIPSVILTIGLMLIMESATSVAFGGGGLVMLNDIQKFSMMPYDLIVGVVLSVVAYICMYKLSLGYDLRAIGSNIAAAKLSGINIDRTRIAAFTVTGFFCGCYAFMSIARGGVVTPRINMESMSLVFDALMCAFIAIAVEKRVNLIAGVFIGSLTVQLIKVGIVSFGIQSVFQQAIIAIFLLVFMVMSSQSELKDVLKRRLRFSQQRS